jgi:hypothetical protein
VNASSELRICASCGEERSALIIPDATYSADHSLWAALDYRPLVVANHPLRCCRRCHSYLSRRRPIRPPHAIHYTTPPVTHLVSQLTQFERALISPIAVVNKLVTAPGGQRALLGGSVTYINDAATVVLKLPRTPTEAGFVHLRTVNATTHAIKLQRVRPELLRVTLAALIRSKHRAFANVVIDETNLAALEEHNARVDIADHNGDHGDDNDSEPTEEQPDGPVLLVDVRDPSVEDVTRPYETVDKDDIQPRFTQFAGSGTRLPISPTFFSM